MFETTNEIPFMELKHLATTQPCFSARRNTQNKGGTSEALTLSLSRSDHLRPRKTNDESSDPISGSVDSMVKIEKKSMFGPRNMGWKRALLTVVWCCMMLYDVVWFCMMLYDVVWCCMPSSASCWVWGWSPLYWVVSNNHPRSTWTCCFYPYTSPYCLVAIAVGSPFSACNWQQGLGRRPDLTRLINQLRSMGCSSRNKDEWKKSCFLVFTRML